MHKWSFHLVIERLFISGGRPAVARLSHCGFPSRYQAAFHFRLKNYVKRLPPTGFNLVLERLFILGRLSAHGMARFTSFNLVLERLFILGPFEALTDLHHTAVWFQSRSRAASHFRIGLVVGAFVTDKMFQSRYQAASHFRVNGG